MTAAPQPAPAPARMPAFNDGRRLTRFQRARSYRNWALLTLVCFAAYAGQGCVAIRVRQIQIQPPAEKSSIALRLYRERPSGAQLDDVFAGAATTLYCLQADGTFAQVCASQAGMWTLQNAAPGTYRLLIGPTVVIDGKTHALRGDRSATFHLPADRRAEIQVVLKKTPVGLIAVVVVVVVVVAAIAVFAAKDKPSRSPQPAGPPHAPRPPRSPRPPMPPPRPPPPPPRLPPPPPLFIVIPVVATAAGTTSAATPTQKAIFIDGVFQPTNAPAAAAGTNTPPASSPAVNSAPPAAEPRGK